MEHDLISNLPKTILHDILSRLPEKDAARTSVLSKVWAETWFTFPILSFSDTKIIGTFPQPQGDFLRKRRNFVDHVKRTLLRFCDQDLAIKEFKLIINCFDLQYMSRDVDCWMKLASESGVGVLELCLPDGPEQDEEGQDRCYILPTGIIEAKSLYKLVLMGGIRVDQAFLNHSVKFFSLRVLSLWLVLLGDEQAIEHLISCCPLIEHITLKCCSVLHQGGAGGLVGSQTSRMHSIRMLGLPKLKEVDIQGIQEVIIDAPSLEYFCFCPGGDLNAPFKMDIDKCRNLRGLHLWSLKSTTITDKWFLDLFPKFPFLESLKFVNCTMSETINISSAKLKLLELSNCSNLKEVNIDAPNLVSCGYCGDGASKPVISFLKSSSQLEVNVLIHIDFMDLGNLREFIQNFKPQNVLASLSLFIHQPIVDELNLDVLQVLSTPPSIKHLDLRAVPKNKTLYLPLVNSLLSSCCPATISLSLHSFFCSRAFIEFFYETLMRRKEEECFCSSGHTKCWWHDLKDVKVSTSTKTNENVDFKTMLDALPTFSPQENISFRLEL
ncbi:putative FBD-associated F-box protein At5g53635 isoform X1 [Cajanus cajan]|uniref:F-box/FBD/LRR-repeat protein At4g00160 family n=1 Tax=Cajanus cajan TaxID=3821 RepID=A0A151SH40_CAJCA|nr:putative FBD-associated F-box protein At5g53635 isoform X1 [Cajanus cajan]XP_020227504.1 putative FBD-associated F-box protein At5g53635 isoform X1 [Cajanus cajan]KYP54089.1 F-box/FBD/LRR-repeat protein At4g00160 family [Cajanus cajan]